MMPVRPWQPPDPPLPAAHGRLSAMCRSILLSAYGPESDRPWAAEAIDEMLRAARRLAAADREVLQDRLDREVERRNREDEGKTR